MTNSKRKGNKGEEQAANYLAGKGYVILERNFRAGRSEIDIICSINDSIIFVEVKFRTSSSFGYPEEFVSENQVEKIHLGAEEYIRTKDWHGNIRFDIISVIEKDGALDIEHFEDAF